MKKTNRTIGISTFFLSLLFIAIGILRQEHWIVLKKSVKICLECIGVG